MTRIHRPAALVLVVLLGAPAGAGAADARYESTITATDGLPDGVEVEVRGGDEQITIDNDSDSDIIVRGYDGESYVRITADGTVEVNDDSPSTYLNTVRDGRVTVPADADGRGEPRWRTIDRSGSFTWYDHRIHWMASTRPPQVTDPAQRTEVFDWEIPVTVDGRDDRATISGTLVWAPEEDGSDTVGILAAVGAVLAGGAFLAVAAARRRLPARRRGGRVRLGPHRR